MRTAVTTTTEGSDLDRLVSRAIRATNSQSVSGVERCFDILRHLKSLSLSGKDLRLSKAIHLLESLRNHENPKIRMGVQVLFKSWMKTLYSGRREASSNRNKALLQRPIVGKVSSELKKKEDKRYVAADGACEYTPTRIRLHLTQKKLDVSKLKMTEDERSQAHETGETKQILNKSGDCKSRFIQAKKQATTTLPLKQSINPRFGTRGTEAIKQNLKKPEVYNSVPAKPKKNDTEMLELFDIAKKSADVANAKGLLFSKSETSICVDTLSLLIGFPISATAPETRFIMQRLERLTKHRDRKICNSSSALLQHWRQSIIRDQQHGDAPKTQRL